VHQDLAAVLDAVGPRLRGLRTRRGMTLAAVAAETGISVSTLSRLESGGRRATLELLLPLAHAYRVTLDDLVGAPAAGDPRVHQRPFGRDGVTIVPLTQAPEGVQAVKVVFPGVAQSPPPEPRTHEGYEWMYVLAGRVRLRLADRDLVLVPGEAAEFDTRVPHQLSAAGPDGAEVLTLYGPQGERVHVRARPRGTTPTVTGRRAQGS
jgi:transcriptional regulator with XRE-family HTH domain